MRGVVSLIAAVMLLVPAVCSAQLYAGATVGAGGANVPFGSLVSGFRGELRLFGGYEVSRYLAAEVMTLDLGTPTNLHGMGAQSTIGAFGVAIVGTLPVQRWRFSARLGALSMDGRVTETQVTRKAQAMLGVGVGFAVMPRLTIGLESAVSHVEFGSPIDDRVRVNWTAFTTSYRFW
jgi:Outer membrane protein beta-barrel domain